jgi:hypothetical protein
MRHTAHADLLSAYYINIGANLSGPCFLLISFSSREPRLREAAAHARASPPRGRSDGRHPVSSPHQSSLRGRARIWLSASGHLSPCGSARFCASQNRQRASRRPHGRAGGKQGLQPVNGRRCGGTCENQPIPLPNQRSLADTKICFTLKYQRKSPHRAGGQSNAENNAVERCIRFYAA